MGPRHGLVCLAVGCAPPPGEAKYLGSSGRRLQTEGFSRGLWFARCRVRDDQGIKAYGSLCLRPI